MTTNVSVKHSLRLDCFLWCPQWVKTPLLYRHYRGLCRQSSVDVWKSPASARLPAHLCACALLGKVARLAAFRPCQQKTAENIPRLRILETTGRNVAHLDIRVLLSLHFLVSARGVNSLDTFSCNFDNILRCKTLNVMSKIYVMMRQSK